VKAAPHKLVKTYLNLLDKGVKMRIVKVDKETFELEDGSVYPIEPPLEQEITIDEFQKIYGKTLEALRSCGITRSIDADTEDVDQ
jgi:hypothetical protein